MGETPGAVLARSSTPMAASGQWPGFMLAFPLSFAALERGMIAGARTSAVGGRLGGVHARRVRLPISAWPRTR
jgi:hypothetical protein